LQLLVRLGNCYLPLLVLLLPDLWLLLGTCRLSMLLLLLRLLLRLCRLLLQLHGTLRLDMLLLLLLLLRACLFCGCSSRLLLLHNQMHGGTWVPAACTACCLAGLLDSHNKCPRPAAAAVSTLSPAWVWLRRLHVNNDSAMQLLQDRLQLLTRKPANHHQ
jgi:hypothetical protein